MNHLFIGNSVPSLLRDELLVWHGATNSRVQKTQPTIIIIKTRCKKQQRAYCALPPKCIDSVMGALGLTSHYTHTYIVCTPYNNDYLAYVYILPVHIEGHWHTRLHVGYTPTYITLGFRSRSKKKSQFKKFLYSRKCVGFSFQTSPNKF